MVPNFKYRFQFVFQTPLLIFSSNCTSEQVVNAWHRLSENGVGAITSNSRIIWHCVSGEHSAFEVAVAFVVVNVERGQSVIQLQAFSVPDSN